MQHNKLRLLPLVAVLVASFSGCAVIPKPLTDSERKERIQQDMDALFKDVEPISGELSLHEALARALKYNYDARLKLMEEALANRQLDLSHYDLLPRLTVSAGYTARNNDAGASSINLNTGVAANPPLYSGAQERQLTNANAIFAWNILDFGVSYVRTQQQAEQTLMANERKRKVVQNIMQDVRQAYWRAYGAQQLLPKLDELLEQVNKALARSRSIEEQRLMAPIDALTYQRGLIDLYQQIVAQRQELILAKTELAALINLKPGTAFTLSSQQNLQAPDNLSMLNNIDTLDQAALANRPELREEDYRKRITVLEARKALYSLLPGIEFTLSENYDSNKYLLNNDWNSAGVSISANLFRAFSYRSSMKVQEAQAKLDDTRRVALSMAVLTQVRIAAQRYRESVANYEITTRGADVDGRIQNHMESAVRSNTENDMTLLRAKVKSSLSDMQRYTAYANMQMSYARLANSIGVDLLPSNPDSKDLKAFTQQLSQADEQWYKNNFNSGKDVQ